MTIQDQILRCQTHVNERLSRYLAGSNERLLSAIRYSALNGGKRLRPLLVYTSAEMFGLTWENVDPIALAIEAIHCYSLIHDDLPAMDNDDLRRGKPSCHKAFDEATAILAGDALLTFAFEILSCDNLMPTRIIHLIAKASGMQGMVRGQSLDLAAENQLLTLPQLCEVHETKTGALITASVLAGALASSRTTIEDENALSDFGRAIGVAFQIQDDLLDAIGESAQTGKATQQDSKKRKNTFVTLLGVEKAQQQAKHYYEQAMNALTCFGEKATPLRKLSAYVIERVM